MASSSLDLEAAVPVRLAARLLGVTPATVKAWAYSGKIEPVGRDRALGRLYRVGDLLETELLTRDNPRGHRKPVTIDATA